MLCVYDIILNLVCLMRYDEIVYIDLEMSYKRRKLYNLNFMDLERIFSSYINYWGRFGSTLI
jgi:hypothetical protein